MTDKKWIKKPERGKSTFIGCEEKLISMYPQMGNLLLLLICATYNISTNNNLKWYQQPLMAVVFEKGIQLYSGFRTR
jgi:hypothetical protein